MDFDNKISIRQIIAIFLIGIASPVIRVIPRYCSQLAQSASWVTTIIAPLIFLVLLYILNSLLCKNNSSDSLEDVFIKVFGKFIGKTTVYVYIVWLILMFSVYLRYFADRITSSIFVATPNTFFITTILFIIFIVVRRDIKFFARYIDFILLIFVVFLFTSFFISIPSINIKNLLPVTIYDTGKIMYATIPLMAVLGYITYMFFIGDKISNKKDFKSHFPKIVITVMLTSLMVIFLTVGVLGHKLTESLNLPFFVFFKNIEILGIFERIESVLITFWIVTDFCIITMFAYISVKLIKKNLELKSTKQIVTPVLCISYILSQDIGSNIFEINSLSERILVPGNLILGCIMPLILLIIGKIRKKV